MTQRTEICRFVYHSALSSEGKMFTDLEVAFERLSISGELAKNIKLCVSEGFTNALTHGNNLNPDKRVILTLTVNDREIRADIEDEGQGGASKVQNREKPSYLAESGRGIDIINRCSIRAETDLAESGGLLLRMWFSREGKNRRRRRSKVKQIAT